MKHGIQDSLIGQTVNAACKKKGSAISTHRTRCRLAREEEKHLPGGAHGLRVALGHAHLDRALREPRAEHVRRDVGGALGRLPVEAEHAVRAVERRELRCVLRRERAVVGGQELLRELRELRGG